LEGRVDQDDEVHDREVAGAREQHVGDRVHRQLSLLHCRWENGVPGDQQSGALRAGLRVVHGGEDG
jgi:hypothetical protein